MSHQGNDDWLQAAQENFQGYVEQENMDMARAVIADLKDNGFAPQASALEAELDRLQSV